MNNLSILLYAASVSENLCLVLMLGSIIALVSVGVWKFVAEVTERPQPKSRNVVIGAAVAAAIAAFLPSKQTVYMIAASETAERVAATPEAREMMELLRRKIIATLSEKT